MSGQAASRAPKTNSSRISTARSPRIAERSARPATAGSSPFRSSTPRESPSQATRRDVQMGKSIRELMSDNPCSIDADKSVAYAAKMMRDEDVGLAPIVEGDRLVGTLTDRDIATRVVAEGRNPETTTAREVASTDVVTIEPDARLDDALQLMAKHQVRRLPVVEQGDRLVGVVAQADVAEHAEPSQTGRMVGEISE